MIKLAIIYYSQTGHNLQMAKWAKEAAEELNCEVRVRKVHEYKEVTEENDNPGWQKTRELEKDIKEATLDDIEWADAILFSTATRFGNMAFQLKAFLDSTGSLWGKGKTVNKVVSAMSTAQNVNGGVESAIQEIYRSMMHWGAIIVPIGYADKSVFDQGGNPYGASGNATFTSFTNEVEPAVKFQTKRLVQIAEKIAK
ncbi:MAG: NAD(P)H-dependent oxidoreductase [Peptoniphilaceae bacterium]|nr:NAD(P)H-dependent oxidoreductase [Peptoniphilaceae bacterium]MDD7383926.1 NAD(P)H-dependent oxidoreductase [Peptoniphilaceae bacterium]MDY3738069.1 NAD(P)H-dependent oxidoreductase [Peptoniphilaceae bacterium]